MVPLRGQLAQMIDEEVRLRGGGPASGGRIDEGGVEWELTQPRQGGEDGDPFRLGVIDQTQHALPLTLEVLVVEMPVRGMRLDGHHLDLLRRQVDRDLLPVRRSMSRRMRRRSRSSSRAARPTRSACGSSW